MSDLEQHKEAVKAARLIEIEVEMHRLEAEKMLLQLNERRSIDQKVYICHPFCSRRAGGACDCRG